MEKVRMAIIGLGNRGYGNMRAVMSFDDVQITAVCDVYTDRAERAAPLAGEKRAASPLRRPARASARRQSLHGLRQMRGKMPGQDHPRAAPGGDGTGGLTGRMILLSIFS